MLFESSARAQGLQPRPSSLESEVAEMRAENGVIREQLRERGYVHATYSSKIVNRSSSNVVQRLQHICDGAKSHADTAPIL